ncbi:hypothetical protein DK26_15180 [Bosea sp. WAO]|uniref:hypothetical protein n=1 Tax=Bosea sp. WAO TaxID=406341 RepID=UPI0007490407|nr:hypothetical protein [Bosea sp. WAO]KUL94348.1 hypothetical protein DK26_15180 [Bosea sp. WAO]
MTLPTRHSPEQPTVVINTPAEYEVAQREVGRLANAEPGSVDALTYQAFSAAIEAYEAGLVRQDSRSDRLISSGE